MPVRSTTILGALLLSFGITSCYLTLGAKEKLVMDRAPDDLGCEPTLLTIKETGKNTYSVMGCNKRAAYVLECRGADTESCVASLKSVTN
jgi:hypothetical protein